MEGKLVIVSAPSGAGKTTLISHLLKSGVNLEFSVSATTRRPRIGEIDGREYYFLTVADFSSRVEANQFVEWEEVYPDHCYGTLKSELDRIWSHGNHVLFDVDVQGGVNLKKIFGNRAISVFIMPPSVEELENRLIRRGSDDIDKIMMRLEKAHEELRLSNQFDHVIVNDRLDDAAQELCDMVTHFLSATES